MVRVNKKGTMLMLIICGGGGQTPRMHPLSVLSLLHNMAKTRDAFDATLKCKDRIDFYPCVADTPVDTADRTCHKFIVEISCVVIVQNPLDAW